MTQPAMLAALKRISSRRTRHELDHRRSTLANLEAIFTRTEYQPRIAFRFGSIGIETNFEAVLSIQRCNLQLYLGALFHMDRRRVKFVFFGSHLNHPHILIRLRCVRWSGGTSGDEKDES